jgi:hypothetical protein
VATLRHAFGADQGGGLGAKAAARGEGGEARVIQEDDRVAGVERQEADTTDESGNRRETSHLDILAAPLRGGKNAYSFRGMQNHGGYGPPGPAQYGYAPHPQPPAYGQAPMPQPYGMSAAAARTVMGVPLEPGEHVIWFRRHHYTLEMVQNLVLGALLLIVLVGVVFIVLALTVNGRKPRAHILTTYRLIYITGRGQVHQFPLNHIAGIEAERQRASGGGGLVGAAVGAAITAAQNHIANQNPKLDLKYWKRTVAIKLAFGNGARARVPVALSYGAELGLLTARAVFNREANTLPRAQTYLP